MSQVIFQGPMIGRESLTNLEFNPAYFFSGCLLCGEVYQTEQDRNPPPVDSDEYPAFLITQRAFHIAWRNKENKRHSHREHVQHQMSGLFCTPEAAAKLAPLGLFSLTDLAFSDEVAASLREAPRAPENDAQGPTGLN